MDLFKVDGFFMELIASPRLPADEHEIVLHNDGTWDPLPPKVGLQPFPPSFQLIFAFSDSGTPAHASRRPSPCLLLPGQ